MPSYYTYNSSNFKDRNTLTSTVRQASYGVKRYFSSLDTDVYFGSTIVEEMVMINFDISEPKLPIYGYNSFFPNRMVPGRKVVQGTFAINFTRVDYLLNILNSIDDSVLHTEYDSIINRCEGNYPLFDKQFDITISYGYGKTDTPTYMASYQMLLGVQIINYQQALDTEGNPILDMYQFIAKDIDLGNVAIPTDSTDTGQAKNEKPEKEKLEYIFRHYADSTAKNIEADAKANETLGLMATPFIKKEKETYKLALGLTSYNVTSLTIESIQMTLTDTKLGVNLSANMGKDLNTNYELKDTHRNQAVLIDKEYQKKKEKNKTYECPCTIEVKCSGIKADGESGSWTCKLDTTIQCSGF